jgi:hypothetical protein
MPNSNVEVLECASIDDLQSRSPERRMKALEILHRNACMFYGESAPVTAAERHRLEAARLELAQSIAGIGKTNI